MTATTVPAPLGRSAAPVPRGREVAVVLVVSLGAMLLLAGGGVFAGATLVGGRSAVVVLAAAGGAVGVWAGLWLTLRRRLGWRWHDLGFVRGRRSPWHLLWQVPAAMTASLLGAAALGRALGLSPEGAAAERDLLGGADLSPVRLLLVATCVVVVLPAAEEVLFRRVLLDWALTRARPAVAVLLTGAAFAALHIVPVAMTYLVFLGVFTAVLRLWHANLWAPLALHAFNNALVTIAAVQAV